MNNRIVFFLMLAIASAQVTPVAGLHDNTPRIYALKNVAIVSEPGKFIENGIVVIRDGIITAAGAETVIPSDAFEIDMIGKTVYAGFIESYWKREDKKPATFYLNKEKNYPMGLMGVEKMIKYNNLKTRADIILYNKEGNPIMIVECKAPNVKITQDAFNQIAKYNFKLQVPFLVVTNGIQHFCCQMPLSPAVRRRQKRPKGLTILK